MNEWTGVKGAFANTKLHLTALWRVQTQDPQIRDPLLRRLSYEIEGGSSWVITVVAQFYWVFHGPVTTFK